jgi:hypothetical protein
MSGWQQYVERKIDTALMLNEGKCHGSYSDACVLLSALISGMAAELWPGKDIDRKRFVDLWVQYSDPQLNPLLVSVPLLRRFLERSHRTADVHALESARPKIFELGYGNRVLCDRDIDMSETELNALNTTITQHEIRTFSYPAVFYRDIRSNLAHEYRLSDDAASHFATRKNANVSYVNRVDLTRNELSRRLIHFHVEWIASVTRSIAKNVTQLIEDYTPLPQPKRWWIDA